MDKQILKNSSWLLAAQTTVKGIGFFYNIFLARVLGVENFGLYIAALSYYSLIASLADFGVSRYVIREASIDRSKLPSILPISMVFRFIVLGIFLAAFVLGVSILDPDITRQSLFILAIFAALPQTFALTLDASFVALLKIKYSAIATLFLSIVTAFSGFVLVSWGYGPFGAVLALVVGQTLYVIFLTLLAYTQNIRWAGKVKFNILKEIVRGSLPYGLLGILGLLYFKIDSLLLLYLKGSFDTGIYGAAYKFLEAITFIPTAFGTAMFPVMSRYQEDNLEKVKGIYFKSLKLLFLISLLMTLGFFFVLPIIIPLVLPQYIQSIDTIKILSFTIPFMFAQASAIQVLFSTDKYLKSVIIISFGTIAFNIFFNLLLIPSLGYIGSSVVTVLSEIISFLVFYIFVQVRVFKHEPNLRGNS